MALEIAEILNSLNPLVTDPLKAVFAIIILFLILLILRNRWEVAKLKKNFQDTYVKITIKTNRSISFGGLIFKSSKIASYSKEDEILKEVTVSHGRNNEK